MAPEVITEAGTDQKADLWSLGITCIEMTCGKPPYAEKEPMVVVVAVPKQPAPTLEGKWSSTFKDFVKNCLVKVPEKVRIPRYTLGWELTLSHTHTHSLFSFR